jgi:single-strand DNA-binding protein
MYHKIIVAGYLGRDPEMRYTPSGKAVTNFSVASTRRWTSGDGQQQEETVWFRVSAWGRQAEVCNQYLAKGRAVLVEGRLQSDNGNPRVWTGQDGQPRASFEITAQTVRFLGRRDEAPVTDLPEMGEEPEFGAVEEEEEIPF